MKISILLHCHGTSHVDFPDLRDPLSEHLSSSAIEHASRLVEEVQRPVCFCFNDQLRHAWSYKLALCCCLDEPLHLRFQRTCSLWHALMSDALSKNSQDMAVAEYTPTAWIFSSCLRWLWEWALHFKPRWLEILYCLTQSLVCSSMSDFLHACTVTHTNKCTWLITGIVSSEFWGCPFNFDHVRTIWLNDFYRLSWAVQ